MGLAAEECREDREQFWTGSAPPLFDTADRERKQLNGDRVMIETQPLSLVVNVSPRITL